MIKQLVMNNRANTSISYNRPNNYITLQYITDNQTLRLIDTYNQKVIELVSNGKVNPDSSIIEKLSQLQNVISEVSSITENIKINGIFQFKGTTESKQQLPLIDNQNGDVYQVQDKEYAWNGINWVELGPDVGDFVTQEQINIDVQQQLSSLIAKINSIQIN